MKRKEIQLLREVKDYIDGNLSKPILVKELCSIFCINKNKLQSGFQLAFGHTIHDYVVRQKMQRAADRLKTTTDPLKAIAIEHGYTASQFNTRFKKHFGRPPHLFRKLFSHIIVLF